MREKRFRVCTIIEKRFRVCTIIMCAVAVIAFSNNSKAEDVTAALACLIIAKHYDASTNNLDWVGNVSVSSAAATGRTFEDQIEIAVPSSDQTTVWVSKADFDQKTASPVCNPRARKTAEQQPGAAAATIDLRCTGPQGANIT